jgi:DNA polymerase-2
VAYNLADARLAGAIVARLQLVELTVARSRLTGLPPERVSASIAAFDSLYLVELHRRGVVAPALARDARLSEPTGGGHVLEPLPGLHDNVIVLDFRSLYPSLMRTFQIDPLNLLRAGTRDEPDLIVAPNGARFRRTPAPLAEILTHLTSARRAAQAAGDGTRSQAIKILMNSFYGVLGTPACRFYEAQLANAITGFGRTLLLWSRDFIEASGRRVLYGDTDSLFVASGLTDAQAARRAGQALAGALQQALAQHVARTWGVVSQLEPQFERLYRRLVLPSMRHTEAGARKRYVGLVDTASGPQVVFVGMEAVRGDWTELARRAQRELYARLFAEEPVAEYLVALLAELRAGRLDAQLVYRKALRKALDDYTATTPPHVAAARKLGRVARGRVAYVMTVAGPEPTRAHVSRLDHEHYVQRQLRPIAEPVLALLGLDFDALSGGAHQLRLF